MSTDKRSTALNLLPPKTQTAVVKQHVKNLKLKTGITAPSEPQMKAGPHNALSRPSKAPHTSTKEARANTPRHSTSVWSKYDAFTSTHHREDLSGATRKRETRERVFVVHVVKPQAESRLSIVDCVSSPYLAAVTEVYESPSTLDFVCDFFELTLIHFQTPTVDLSDRAIAAVAGQVISALRYLSSQNLIVSSLEADSIFVAYQTGTVKILPTDLQHAPNKPQTLGTRDVQQLGQVMFSLATKQAPSTYDPDSHALVAFDSTLRDFLRRTEKATAAELAEVCYVVHSRSDWFQLTHPVASIPSYEVTGTQATSLGRSLCY